MLGSLLFVRPSEGEFAVPDVNTEVVILFWADMTLAEVSCAAVTRELGVANELNVRIPFVAFSVEADIVAFGLLGSLLGPTTKVIPNNYVQSKNDLHVLSYV
jgi:hypothetical protein